MRTKLSQFKFDLPEKLIAKYPAKQREDSRMMVVNRASGTFEHKTFRDLLGYFDDGDTFIFNNTKVFPARLFGRKEKTGAKIEVFLLRELNNHSRLWDVLVDPARKIRVGNKLYFTNDADEDRLVAEVVDNTTSRGRTIRFLFDGNDEAFRKELYALGSTPIPKILGREAEKSDTENFQTVLAKELGAVAPPSAGLHFSEQTLLRMQINGINRAEVTLHLGLGSFREIEVEDLSKHKMDAEYFRVPQETVDIVNASKLAEKKICAIGTTVMRSIETSVSAEGLLKPNEGWTNKFIFPPFDFSIADSMLTNFHLPQSSLYIMAAAFGDTELIAEAYEVAIKEKYRFYTYGDCMLIL